jgi:hypothetical protein
VKLISKTAGWLVAVFSLLSNEKLAVEVLSRKPLLVAPPIQDFTWEVTFNTR